MTQPLWTSQAAKEATDGELTGGPWAATGISIDTRTLQPGDLFVAIEGLDRDGHEFIAAAEKAGAAAVLVSRPAGAKGPCLVVADTLEGLNALARAARARCQAKVVAITGSVGKTSTKEALLKALQPSGKVHASELSYNNLWGVPLSLARMPEDTQYGVFEIGMNHPGEIIPLTAMVEPDVAIVTTVASVHLEFFKDETEIAEAKAEIFSGLKAGGIAIINRDSVHFDLLKTRADEAGAGKIIGFGEHAEAETRLTRVKLHETCTCVAATINGTDAAYGIGAAGKHWALNSLAVLSAVDAVGADLAKAALAMRDVAPPKGRGERQDVRLASGGGFTLIDESYNANPASMRAALSTLGAIKPAGEGRRIAILGDMRELGETSQALHIALAPDLKATHPDLLFCCGPRMAALWNEMRDMVDGAHAAVSTDLIDPVISAIRNGDVVTIKGSLGTNMAPIVSALLDLDCKQSQNTAKGA